LPIETLRKSIVFYRFFILRTLRCGLQQSRNYITYIMDNMPSIILKYKSPEFVDTNETPQNANSCEMPGCINDAEHKAPKHRALDEYYNFCSNHITEYNKAWDFFSGMSETEVQNHMSKSRYGDRPTWKRGADDPEDKLYKAARDSYHYGEPPNNKEEHKKRKFSGDINTPEHEAMALMGLEPPVTLNEIKTRYKTLAKKHHPDLNKSDPNSEELFKKVNMAYTILKLAFSEYQNLPDPK